MDDSIAITGIRRNNRGNWDVEAGYALEVEQLLRDAQNLAAGGTHVVSRPYFRQSQIRGKIQHITAINSTRGQALLNWFRGIDWEAASAAAHKQELVVCKRSLTHPSQRPVPELA